MNMINTAPDTPFLNKIFDTEGKKNQNHFIINRLSKAVEKLALVDKALAISAKADLLTYKNNAIEAIELINKNINLYGFSNDFLDSLLRASKHTKDWQITEDIWDRYFNKNNLSLISSDIKERYNEFLDLYLIQNEINKGFLINERLEKLANIGVSIETYRKIIDISLAEFSKEFNGNLLIAFNYREEDLLVVLYNKFLEEAETKFLTQKINEEILAVDDINFQIEADLIQVIAVNFSPDKIPEDFNMYEDDLEDDELFEIIHQRQSLGNLKTFEIEVECV